MAGEERPPWFEHWKAEVFDYRMAELQKELSMVMATMNRLDTIVTKMENVAERTEKLSSSFWVRAGVVAVVLSPLAAAIFTHFWR